MSDRRTISSRELGSWLFAYADVLGAHIEKMRTLRTDYPNDADDVVEHMRVTARWLSDAKFVVQDPFRFDLVCQYLKKVTNEDIEKLSAETLTFMRAMANAALNDDDMIGFIK